jgi:hypothetical protein
LVARKRASQQPHIGATFNIIADRFICFVCFTRRMKYDQRVNDHPVPLDGGSWPKKFTQDLRHNLEHTQSSHSVPRWCQYVRQGREDLHDEAPSGRAPIDFLDIQILLRLDEPPYHSAHSIAYALGVPHSTMLELFRMKKLFRNDRIISKRMSYFDICTLFEISGFSRNYPVISKLSSYFEIRVISKSELSRNPTH